MDRDKRLQMIEQTLASKGRKVGRGEAFTTTSIYCNDVAFLLDEVKKLEAEVEEWQEKAAGEDI